MNDKLLASARFYFAQSVFMTTCHYKAYSRLGKRVRRNKNIVLIISSCTVIVLILQIIGLEKNIQALFNILAFVGLLLTGSSLIFSLISKEDLSIIMCSHKSVAENYKRLRDNFMCLIEEIMSNAYSEKILRERRDILQDQYSGQGEFAPETTYADYSSAQKGLGISKNSNEEFTWSDSEIDKFLPEKLRLPSQAG